MHNVYRISTSESAAALSDASVMGAMDEQGTACWVRPGENGAGIVDCADCPDWSTTVRIEQTVEHFEYFAGLVLEAADMGCRRLFIRPIGKAIDTE